MPGMPSTDDDPRQRQREESQDGGQNQVGDGLVGVQGLDGEVHRAGQEEQESAAPKAPELQQRRDQEYRYRQHDRAEQQAHHRPELQLRPMP